jgi:hypothetical protein
MPAPLCEPPHMFDDGVPSERPLGLGSAAGSATWRPKDLPMHLHTFAYVVRGTLLAWWREASDPGGPQGNSQAQAKGGTEGDLVPDAEQGAGEDGDSNP